MFKSFKLANFAVWFECALCFLLGRRLGPNQEALDLSEWQQYVLYFFGGIALVVLVAVVVLLASFGLVWCMNRPIEALHGVAALL